MRSERGYKTLPRWIAVALVGALTLSGVAHADGRAHRLKTAGIVVTAMGIALSVVGAALTGYGETHPPAGPRTCYETNGGGIPCGPPPSSNQMLFAGAATLAIGVAALGVGAPLWVVGGRAEQPTLAVNAGAGGLTVSF